LTNPNLFLEYVLVLNTCILFAVCAYILLTKSNQFYFSKASKCDTQYNKKKIHTDTVSTQTRHTINALILMFLLQHVYMKSKGDNLMK